MSYYIRNVLYVKAILWNGANIMKIREFVRDKYEIENCIGNLICKNDCNEIDVNMGDYIVWEGKRLLSMDRETFNTTFRKM